MKEKDGRTWYTVCMDERIDKLTGLIAASERIAFLGGAGLSTESGIPDFRGEAGAFSAVQAYGYPPETLLSHEFFLRHTDVFYDYYKQQLLHPDAQPNAAHLALYRLERQGKLSALITQNIDGLHQRAGSRHVLELHGSVHRNYCMRCHKAFTLADILTSEGVPRCGCGGTVKPDVVLYGEGLDAAVLSSAVRRIAEADMLIIGGTSLVVYPAAGLVDYFTGKNLVVLNMSPTVRDQQASLCIDLPIGEVLGRAVPD